MEIWYEHVPGTPGIPVPIEMNMRIEQKYIPYPSLSRAFTGSATWSTIDVLLSIGE